MKNETATPLFTITLSLLLAGCMTAPDHQRAVSAGTGEKITLGSVQRQINVGMSSAQVVSALGSPNMVTRDRDGAETWIYDKFSSETAYSTSSAGISGLVIAAPLGLLAGANTSAGATTRSQRTLTVIIKFRDSTVAEFSYNSTSF